MINIKHKQTAVVLMSVSADSLEGINLSGANLAGANLAGLKINHACLRGADLQGANLTGTELIGTSLDGANLTHAILNQADLTDASLQRAELGRAQLVEATLRYTKLSGANLSQAKLTGAKLSMADLRATFRGADLQSTDLRGADFSGANLQQADFFQADLSGATITRANFAGARMQGAIMHGVINQQGTASSISCAVQSSMIRRASPQSDILEVGSKRSDRLPVACPYCGHQQDVPQQRLEHHSRCALCQEKFFVDRLGHTRERKKADPGQWTPELQSTTMSYAQAAAAKRPPNKLLLPMFCLLSVVVIGWCAWSVTKFAIGQVSGRTSNLPTRAKMLGQAFMQNDEKQVRSIASPATADAAVQWLANGRANVGPALAPSAEFRIDTRVLYEDTANHRAEVLIAAQEVERQERWAVIHLVNCSPIGSKTPTECGCLTAKALTEVDVVNRVGATDEEFQAAK